MPKRPTTFLLIFRTLLQNHTKTTIMIISPNITLQINFLIIYFTVFLQYFLKKRSRLTFHQQLTGGFAKIFFFSAEPPPPTPYCAIAPFLKYHHSYIAATPKNHAAHPSVLYPGHCTRKILLKPLQYHYKTNSYKTTFIHNYTTLQK